MAVLVPGQPQCGVCIVFCLLILCWSPRFGFPVVVSPRDVCSSCTELQEEQTPLKNQECLVWEEPQGAGLDAKLGFVATPESSQGSPGRRQEVLAVEQEQRNLLPVGAVAATSLSTRTGQFLQEILPTPSPSVGTVWACAASQKVKGRGVAALWQLEKGTPPGMQLQAPACGRAVSPTPCHLAQELA